MENFASIFCIGVFTFYVLLLILLVWFPRSSTESSTLRPGTKKEKHGSCHFAQVPNNEDKTVLPKR